MKFVPEAKRWWRMFSVQASIVVAGLQGMLLGFDVDYLLEPVPLFPDLTWKSLGNCLTIAAAFLGIAGRMIDQGLAARPKKDE